MVTVAPEESPHTRPAPSARNQLREFARSSPARLIAIGVASVLCCLAVGGIAAQEAATRQNALHGLLNNSEPFLNSTQQLYGALSRADAAAGTALLYGGQEPMAVRERYTRAIAEAATQLADGADSDGSDSGRRLRRGIAAQIPIYTGLVETARTEDRDDHPVGAAYLGEASHLMQTTMLPMAQDLHNRQSAAVAATQRQFDAPPWTPIAALVVVLAGILATQVHLNRHWRRRLNPGLLAATALLLLLFTWVGLAGTVSAIAMRRALDHGTTPLATLSDSRILVQQARAAETLKLVRHDTSVEYDQAFDNATRRLDAPLAGYSAAAPGADRVAAARAGLARWLGAHQRMAGDVATGDFTDAATVAVGPGPDDAAAAFTVVDTGLQDGITAARADLRSNVARAATALERLGRGALLLSTGAAIAVVIGMWPRIREYL